MLKSEIEEAKRAVNTDTVQITIGEVANMYSQDELNILPDFQRLFRWSNERKSNFVESILIGIPIPPVFVYENGDATWELIDGLQRISTLLEFMGILRDVDSGEIRRSILLKTKYLPSLENVVWNASTPGENELEKSLQLFFRRARIDFQILKHPSDPKTKFDLFQRLNRGGAYANEQEVRTCSMVLANSSFTQKIRDFASRTDFQKIFQIRGEQRENQRDIEYIVRLIVHGNVDFEKGWDVQEFLDYTIVDIFTNEDEDNLLLPIGWTVETLFRLFGETALIPPIGSPNSIASRFSLRALETIAVGMIRNYSSIKQLDNPDAFVKEKVVELWQQPQLAEMSASGLRGTVRIQRTVPFGSNWFNPNG
ncbi:DUF262 domain-containing protein [Persicitalea jodogahamensis]|uniref:GmrSD restriction endonucleases N-terminal domain-containing protein n=1 Tax=Persicitalea jodogahamensis TaxID=402147 RepID=A0A8J3G8V5_9BACT|nr:DUF262 domain-containing protein [Persicitalea jodogahamensis]GHB68487.1 hypothetical protein GCM10007390_22330 [Persicitalea jodogahamensis]